MKTTSSRVQRPVTLPLECSTVEGAPAPIRDDAPVRSSERAANDRAASPAAPACAAGANTQHPLGTVAVITSGRSGVEDRTRRLMHRCISVIDRGVGVRVGADPRVTPLPAQLEAAHRVSPDTIIAIGGDGTINAAAAAAIHTGAMIVIVPAGTMNLIARDLGIEPSEDLNEEHLSSLRPRRIDYATVNGRLFMHSSHLGLVPSVTSTRERIRSAQSLQRRLRLARLFLARALFSPEMKVVMRSDSGPARIRTRALAVTNNPLLSETLETLRRASVETGRMGVYAVDHDQPLTMLRLGLAAATWGLVAPPRIKAGACSSLEIHLPRRRVRVANDGELISLEPPLRYEIHHRALCIGLPPPPNPTP